MNHHAFADTVQRLFLSYLQQPADGASVDNWSFVLAAHSGDLSCALSAFALAPEALTVRGDEHLATFVSEIYSALFGREPSSTETEFWQQKIDTGTVREHLPWLIQAQATQHDAQIWQERLLAAQAFAAGEAWLDPLLTQQALDHFLMPHQKQAAEFVDHLSLEQQEIIALIGQNWPQDDWLML